MNRIYIIALVCVFFASCSDEPSLQKYFVEKTQDRNFIMVDIAPSILNIKKDKLTAEQNAALESFDKLNILAFKLDDKNKDKYEAEKAKVTAILKDDKYQELMKFGQGQDAATLKFIGDDEHIDEFILFANRKDNGFAVIRFLGDDMNPTGIMNMLSVLQQSNIDKSQLTPILDVLKDKK